MSDTEASTLPPPAEAAGPATAVTVTTPVPARGWALAWLAMAVPIAVVATLGSIWMWLLVMIWLTTGILLGLGMLQAIETLEAHKADLQARLGKAQERVDQLATRDELTGVWNHRHLAELLKQQIAQAKRSGAPLCVTLLELDDFATLSERHGERIADELLRRFAAAVLAVLRASDFAGRLSRERFLLVYPATLPAEAQVGLNRLHDSLVALNLTDLAPDLVLRCSGGLVRVTPTDTQETALARAGQALARAVAAGRDRIELG